MIRLFDVHESGNFEKGRNILRQRSSLVDAASVLKISEQDLYDRLEKIRAKLFAAREKRVHPLKDDKILTDWNGLMIAALAKAAQALHERKVCNSGNKGGRFYPERDADSRRSTAASLPGRGRHFMPIWMIMPSWSGA